jgi:hypothetical protein
VSGAETGAKTCVEQTQAERQGTERAAFVGHALDGVWKHGSELEDGE